MRFCEALPFARALSLLQPADVRHEERDSEQAIAVPADGRDAVAIYVSAAIRRKNNQQLHLISMRISLSQLSKMNFPKHN